MARHMALAMTLASALFLAACGGAPAAGTSGEASAKAASSPARASAAPAATPAGSGASRAGSPASSASRVKVTMAWVAVAINQSIAWMAKEGGYFDQNGLDLTLQYVEGSPVAAAALVSGNLQFVEMAGPAVVSANSHGGHLVFVMGFVNEPMFTLVAAPDITKPEQLKGKTIAVTKVGSSDDFLLREALAHWNLKPNTDVKITPAGSVQGQVAAFQQRQIQALVVSPPNDLLAVKAGGHVLTRVADLGIPYQSSGLVTTRDYAQAQPEVVAKVVRAMTQAVHRFKTDRQFALQVLGKYLKTSDPELLDASYQTYMNVFPRAPAPTLDGMKEIAKEAQASGQVKAAGDVSTMVDTSFVDKLQQSGFIQQLYAQ